MENILEGQKENSITSISEEDRRRFRARFVREVWRKIYDLFEKRKEEGLTRTTLAHKLGVHRSVITKRLRGDCNFTIEILSDMARALDSVPDLQFFLNEDFSRSNNHVHCYTPTQAIVHIEFDGSYPKSQYFDINTAPSVRLKDDAKAN